MFDPATAVAGSMVIGGTAAYLGGQATADATEAAAQTAADASNYATDVSLDMYNTTRGDLAPYNTAGQTSTKTMSDLLGYNGADAQQAAYDAFRSDPGYQFSLDQGTQAVERSAAAKGGLASGNTLAAVNTYAQGVADQSYSDYYKRIMDLATLGENAAAQTGAAGTSAANTASTAATSAASTEAEAEIAGGQSTSNLYTNLANTANKGLSNYLYLNGTSGSGSSGTTTGTTVPDSYSLA